MSGNALVALTTKLANSLGMADGTDLGPTLKATAFRTENQVTDAQMVALLVVANQYGLNPWTKEIYAFPDKKNGIVPVVGVDGWNRIINEHPQMDGIEFRQSETMVTPPGAQVAAPEWMECVIYRKDRSRPIVVREYLDEVYRPPYEGIGRNGPYKTNGPWQTHPKRFLRHKCEIQCARIAFGFAGIFDQDEADRIIEAEAREVEPAKAIGTPRAKSEAKAIGTPRAKSEAKAIESKPDNGVQLDAGVEEGQFEPVEQQQAQEPAQQQQAQGQPEGAPADNEPASEGMKNFIRNKAQEKGIDWEEFASHFKIENLDSITAGTATAMVNWIKAK